MAAPSQASGCGTDCSRGCPLTFDLSAPAKSSWSRRLKRDLDEPSAPRFQSLGFPRAPPRRRSHLSRLRLCSHSLFKRIEQPFAILDWGSFPPLIAVCIPAPDDQIFTEAGNYRGSYSPWRGVPEGWLAGDQQTLTFPSCSRCERQLPPAGREAGVAPPRCRNAALVGGGRSRSPQACFCPRHAGPPLGQHAAS